MLIEVKRGIHTRKLKRKIMSTLGLDKDTHDISIVFWAPQQLVGTQVFYNSISLKCNDDVDIMWGVIKWAGQFIGSNLYVTIDTVGFNVDGGGCLPQSENNVDAYPNPNPNPEWFTSNTWDDIHDPSPSLETGLMSWQPGDESSKGMIFKNKAAV